MCRFFYKYVLILLVALFDAPLSQGQEIDQLRQFFVTPPDNAKPRVYWWWLYNRVNKESITRDLEEFKAKGISGVNLICTGGYAGDKALLGVKWLSPEWCSLYRHAVREAKRLDIELGFNLAGGWTMMGPWVTYDDAMKKVVQSDTIITGGNYFAGKLKQPETIEGYYRDVWLQAFQMDSSGIIEPQSMIDISRHLMPNGELHWNVPKGKWLILRTGYTLTGHPWSRWFAYPQGDTFAEGAGYEIDYLSKKALKKHFDHLGTE